MSPSLDGYRLCDELPKAVNGITAGNDEGIGENLRFIGKESFHPNKLGHLLMADHILEQSENLTKPMPLSSGSGQLPAEENQPILDAPKFYHPIYRLVFDNSDKNTLLLKRKT